MTAGGAKLFLFQTRQAHPQAAQCEFSLFHNPSGIELKAKGVAFEGEPADGPSVQKMRRVWLRGIIPEETTGKENGQGKIEVFWWVRE